MRVNNSTASSTRRTQDTRSTASSRPAEQRSNSSTTTQGGRPDTSRSTFEASPTRNVAQARSAGDTFAQSTRTHTVRPGETLSGIARQYGTTAQAIAQANGIANPDRIQAGQRLQIPGGSTAPTTPTNPTPPPSQGTTYTVRPGDTLSGIAQRHGTTVQAIAQANGITNPDRIQVGQQLRIPGGSTTPTNPTTPPVTGPVTGTLPNDPNRQFSLQELMPTIDRYAQQYGFDPKVLAGMIAQESSFKNHLVHRDGTGHGLLGYDDNGLLPEFEQWVRRTKPGQEGYSAGRGHSASSIPPEWQIEFAAKKLAEYSDRYGGDMAAARAWHRGPGAMNDWRGYNYQDLIQGHMNRLFPNG